MPPLPTAAEIVILSVLWRVGSATVREVHQVLAKDCGYTTTLKQMQLMTEKGLLTRTERFGSHVYESAVPKEQLQQQIAGDLLRRVCRSDLETVVGLGDTELRVEDALEVVVEVLARIDREQRPPPGQRVRQHGRLDHLRARAIADGEPVTRPPGT